MRQYLEDYRSGNVSFVRLLRGAIYSTYYSLSEAGLGIGRLMRWLYDPARFLWGGSKWPRTPGVIPEGEPTLTAMLNLRGELVRVKSRLMRWLYNRARFLWGGSKWPRTPGAIPEGEPTPTVVLNLQPGELVRVKSHEEILQTITTANFNRGMRWDAELVPYCGGTYRVLKRVNQIIHEQTGKMQKMKTPCIILEDVTCQALYSACRMHCPKAMYPYWREIWFERVSAAAAESEWSERGDEVQPAHLSSVLVQALAEVAPVT
jgi:hypothetical protein